MQRRLAPCGALIHLRLPVEPESVAAAHHSVFGIASVLDPAVLDDVRLLISELVTNCIRHARLGPDDWIELQVDIEGGGIRVEVRDPGRGFDPEAIPASRPPEGPGLGLLFVRRIAPRWGVECDGQTRVWFELDLQPPGSGDRFTPRGHG